MSIPLLLTALCPRTDAGQAHLVDLLAAWQRAKAGSFKDVLDFQAAVDPRFSSAPTPPSPGSVARAGEGGGFPSRTETR